MLTRISKGFWDLLWRFWYPLVTRLSGNASVTFLNYGFAGDEMEGKVPVLREEDESDRPCIQLYHRVVRAVDLRGLDVLEVSCGHGGGSSYMARYMQPKSIRGVDRNPKAIALCGERHRVAGLTFSCGNALALAFGNNSFDAVINVEASHCYPDVARFFSEVRRVLRPGGDFLYADFRQGVRGLAVLREQLKESGMEIIGCDNISAGVVRGMELNTEKYEELIRKLVPRFLHGSAMAFAGVKGSTIYKTLEAGETVYLCCHLRKPRGPFESKDGAKK